MLSGTTAVAGCGCPACQAAAAAGKMSLQQFLAADTIKVNASQLAGTAWSALADMPSPRNGNDANIKATSYGALSLNLDAMRTTLDAAPKENAKSYAKNRGIGSSFTLSLPSIDGDTQRFNVVEYSMMEPGLAAQFPDFKTYRGVGIDDPSASLALDVTVQGFHASVLSDNGAWYIDPAYQGDTADYMVYGRAETVRDMSTWKCTASRELSLAAGLNVDGADAAAATIPAAERTSGTQLRTYRLAVAATGEYTAKVGSGTVAGGQAAIVTAINRVNQVYERDLSIRMTLVANNSSLVYTNSSTDPYTNSNGSAMLTQNATTIDSVIGNANYDIGHVFSTGGGGVAYQGVIGLTTYTSGSDKIGKAGGVTGNTNPTGDSFWIDYVCHEMGHQFGGSHTFNSEAGSCGGGNREPTAAYEPGSGTTIMAYAGICSETVNSVTTNDNIQAHSDPFFHHYSVQEILTYVDTDSIGAATGTRTSTGNAIPTVNGGSDYTIPDETPFSLTATGADTNGDTLYYSWEENDLGAAQTLAANDNSSSPIFRSFNPTTSPTRAFPKLASVLAGVADDGIGEQLPLTNRTLNFIVAVRDRALGTLGGGGYNEDAVNLTVVNSGTGFAVTAPNTAVSWAAGSSQTVTWNVSGTTASGINTANVKISLSTDGGQTFPTVLLATTPNDGTQTVTVPNTLSSTARVKIEAIGNIFYDIGNANFTIANAASPAPSAPVLTSTAANDTGISQTDQITKVNTSLIFTVAGVTSGATVKLYNNTAVIGTATASGTSVDVTTTAGLNFGNNTYTFTATQTPAGGTESAKSAGGSVTIDTTNVAVISAPAFVFDSANPSTQSVNLTLAENVSASFSQSASLSVTNATTGTSLPVTASFNSGTQIVSITWPTFNGGILTDGNYTATFNVTDVAGNGLSGGGGASTTFFFVQADANRDRSVDTLDFATLIANFGAGTSKKFSNGDFNYSGVVDSTDFTILVARYGRSVAPGALPGAVPPTPFSQDDESIGLLDELQ